MIHTQKNTSQSVNSLTSQFMEILPILVVSVHIMIVVN